MSFINPNDPPLQRLLDKLIAAKWLHGLAIRENKTGSDQVALQWTPMGKEKFETLLSLFREIEAASLPLSNDEILHLKGIAELITR